MQISTIGIDLAKTVSLSKIRPANRLGASAPAASTRSAIDGELLLDDLPKLWRDDRRMLAGVDVVLVRDLAAVKLVLQHANGAGSLKIPTGSLGTATVTLSLPQKSTPFCVDLRGKLDAKRSVLATSL